MTEIYVIPYKRWPLDRYCDVDVGRFVLATVATPVLFAISGVGIAGVGFLFTVVAAVLSIPAYLLLGLPVFHYVIRHHQDRSGKVDRVAMALAGFVVNAGSLPLAYAYLLLEGHDTGRAAETALWYAGLGMLAAPIMALIFAEVYRGSSRRTAQPVHGLTT